MSERRSRTLVIAEIGVNHNGDKSLAFELIDAAVAAGVDIVKFQTAIPELVQTPSAPKAPYQIGTTDAATSALEMTRSFHFQHETFIELKARVEHCGKEFLSTAFDLRSLRFLESLGSNRVKIPSGEITNLFFLEAVARLKKPTLLSTGMATLDEVDAAIEVLSSGGLPKSAITLLHCNTAYPTPLADCNVLALASLRRKGISHVGFSDHSSGVLASYAAVALGAVVIEKHLTLDKSLPGPDHHASLEPDEFKSLVDGIRSIEILLGSGDKHPTNSELENLAMARRGVYAATNLRKGQKLSADDIVMLRPTTPLSPMDVNRIVGRQLVRDVAKFEALDETSVTS